MDACMARSICSPRCGLATAGKSLSTASRTSIKSTAFRGTPLLPAPLAADRRRRWQLIATSVAQRQAISNGLFDFLTAFTAPKVTDEQRVALKGELLAAIAPLERGLAATDEDREAVEELASQLEAVNPTKQPLRSPLINGKWKLLYTTSDTILARNRPFFLRPVGPIFQAIDAETLQARNLETWPFFNQVQATLTPTSASAVDVKFDVFKILSLVAIKAPDTARGSLDITYLDDDLRISRGNKGNLFVLAMEDASYRIPLAEEDVEEEEE